MSYAIIAIVLLLQKFVSLTSGEIIADVNVRPTYGEDCVKKSFFEYQVLKVKTKEESMRQKLYKEFEDKVEFWRKAHGNDSSVDIFVPPLQNSNVKNFLTSNNISYDVMLSDVENVIQTQSLNAKKLKNQIIKKSVSKRSTRHKIRDMLTIMAHSAGSIIKSDTDDVIQSRADYRRIPRKSLHVDDQELFLLDQRPFYPKMSWTEYHNLETIYSFMRELETKYPHLINIVEIGTTYERRPILLARIGKKINSKYVQGSKRVIFIEAGMHAREWISPSTATFIMNELVVNSHINSDVLDLYNFYILPVANPDGYSYSHRVNRMWRKNRSPNRGLGAMFNPCWGVDINRNFGFKWGSVNIFSSVSGTNIPCLETYSGPRPFSEVETRAIRDFVLANKQDIVMYISLHSYGEKVMYPWSHTKAPLPDWQDLHTLGLAMAESISSVSQQTYWVGSASDSMYVTSGSADDWLRGVAGIKWVYLMELPDKENGGFLLPPSEILRTANGIFSGIRTGALGIAPTLYYFHYY